MHLLCGLGAGEGRGRPEGEVHLELRQRSHDQARLRRDPPRELMEIARDAGCLFSIDSDAHAPGQLDFLVLGCERAEAVGIEPERIVNTWPADRLLAWAGGSGRPRRAVRAAQ